MYKVARAVRAAAKERQRVPPRVRILVAASQAWDCNWCKRRLGSVWHNDHIVPLNQGGTNTIDNYQALCVECHSNKTGAENSRAPCGFDMKRGKAMTAHAVLEQIRALLGGYTGHTFRQTR